MEGSPGKTQKQKPKKFRQIYGKHLSKIKLLYGLVIIVVILGFLLFFFQTRGLDNFINNFLTNQNEGSLTEHSSVINALITELLRLKEDEVKKADEVKFQIEPLLKAAAKKLEKIDENNTQGFKIPTSFNSIENVEYSDLKDYLDFNVLEKLSFRDFGLKSEKIKIEQIDRYSFRTTNGQYKSFLFIPSQLVSLSLDNKTKKKIPVLPLMLKRELVFSRIAEEYMLYILEECSTAVQVYFIGLSGFVRIRKRLEKNQVDYYKNRFLDTHNFADRPYFKNTINNVVVKYEKSKEVNKDKDKCRKSQPYIDIGGLGIVRTYTVPIINKNLEIVGVIGVDFQLKEAIDFLNETNLGSFGFFKNFQIDFSEKIVDKYSNPLPENNSLLLPSEIESINEEFKKEPKKFTSDVLRFDFKKEKTVFTFPVEGQKVAIIVFDKGKLRRNRFLFGLMIILFLVGITNALWWVSKQHVKQVKDKEKQFELFSQMHNSYVITGPDNRIISYNDEFEELIGKKDPLNEDFRDYLTEESRRDYEYFLNSGEEQFEYTVTILSKCEIRKPVIIINAKTEYPTQPKARISVLIESEDFEQAVAEKYVERISHVIKSPLHSILLIAGQLRKKTARNRYSEYYTILDAEIAGLKQEVTRLLSISMTEIKNLKPKFIKIDLTRMIKETRQEFHPMIRQKKIKFEYNIAESVTIWADKMMIKTVVNNILENAFKYTMNGTISLFLREGNNYAIIEVSDTGIGIPAGELEKIFKKGFRGSHPAVLRNDGQGIGLFQCKQYISANNGIIKATSKEEVGTTFTVTISKSINKPKNA
jgi:signal transduction histidine kinase